MRLPDATGIKRAVRKMLDEAKDLAAVHLEAEVGFTPRVRQHARQSPLFKAVDKILDKYAEKRAFWITGIVQESVLKQARNFIFHWAKEHPGGDPEHPAAGIMRSPWNEREFEAQLWQALQPWLPERDKAGRMINQAARSEVIARTNVMDMYNHARLNMMAAPELGNWIEAYRYSAVLDDKTTAICRDLHGKIFTRGTLNGYGPPNHYNCRSVLLPITRLDRGWRDEWAGQPVPVEVPQEGFGGRPGAPPEVPAGKEPIPGAALPPAVVRGGAPGRAPAVRPERRRRAVPVEPKTTEDKRTVSEEGSLQFAEELVENFDVLPATIKSELREMAERAGPVDAIGKQDLKDALNARAKEMVRERLRAQVEARRAERLRLQQEEAARIAAERQGQERVASEIAEGMIVGRLKPVEHVEGWGDLPAWIRKKAGDWAWRQGEITLKQVPELRERLRSKIMAWQAGPQPEPGRGRARAPRGVGDQIIAGAEEQRRRVRARRPAVPRDWIIVDPDNFRIKRIYRERPGRMKGFNTLNWRLQEHMRDWFRAEYPGGMVPKKDLRKFKMRFAEEMEIFARDRGWIGQANVRGVLEGYKVHQLGEQIPVRASDRPELISQMAREVAARAARIAAENQIREEARRRREQQEAQERERRRIEREAAERERVRLEELEARARQTIQKGSPAETVEIVESKALGSGGVNETMVLKDRNGKKWFFKPEEGERFHIRDVITNEKMTLAMREVLSYRLDQLLGLDLVPETVLRTYRGRWGSAQAEAIGAKEELGWSGRRMTPAEAYKMGVLDVALGNTDRHKRNYMRKQNGEPVAIDNGYSFPEAGEVGGPYGIDGGAWIGLRSTPLREVPSGADPLGEAGRRDLARKIRSIDLDQLTEGFPMSTEEFNALKARLRKLAESLEQGKLYQTFSRYNWG